MSIKTVGLILIGALIISIAIDAGLKKQEISECKIWQEQAEQYPGFYLTDWQKAQCEAQGIEIKLPEQPQSPQSNEQAEKVVILEIEIKSAPEGKFKGKASYYDYVLSDGWSSKGHRVCAVRDWPRGTVINVTNTANGKSVECLVTDYGPRADIHPDRIIDLSSYAFSQIADLKQGVVNVEVVKINNQ